MKKILYNLLLSCLIISCGDKGGDSVVSTNKEPFAPTIKSPAYGSNCVVSPVTLEWNSSSDQDGSVKEYQVEIAKDNSFTNIVENQTTVNNTLNVNLAKATVYYWRVKAIDDKGLASGPSVSKFTVPATVVLNQLPTIPSLVFPLNNAQLANTTKVVLKWNIATDADVNDVVTYDVYVGDISSQTKVAEKLTSTSYELTVSTGTYKYWKVVARDSKGGATFSPLWSFKVL